MKKLFAQIRKRRQERKALLSCVEILKKNEENVLNTLIKLTQVYYEEKREEDESHADVE